MKELCHLYADKMRPESKAVATRPIDRSVFLYYPAKSFAVCMTPGVEEQGIKTVLSKGDENEDTAAQGRTKFNTGYPKVMEELKKVILVRHPMERLLSVYL